jgi:conjugal transfer pilus assembly protein TraF
MIIRIITVILTIIILPEITFAASFYHQNCQNQNLGWNFYCDKEQQQTKEQNQELTQQNQAELANKEIERLRKEHDSLLNTAIIFPSEENVKKYLAFNLTNLNRSSFFAETAQREIWQNPDLNYNLKRPVNSIGKRTWIDEQNQKQKQTVLSLNSRYGIFFFYRSDCPYCHAYSPVLKDFANRYHLKIKAVSLDGGLLKEWQDSIIDSGQAAKLGISAVPATVLFDKQNQNIIPIGFGALSQEELLQQIYALTQTKPGEEL